MPMKEGKVVILGGTPRSGKTTLALMLARRGYSKLSFDIINEAIEKGLPQVVIEHNHDQESCAKKLYPFFATIVGGAVDEARRFGLNTVIDMYDYTPEYISRLPDLADLEVYFLAYPGFNVAEIRTNIRQYAQPEDWIAQVDEDYLTVVAERCDRVNQKLVRQCGEYGFRLVDTGAGDDRDRVLTELCHEIVGE